MSVRKESISRRVMRRRRIASFPVGPREPSRSVCRAASVVAKPNVALGLIALQNGRTAFHLSGIFQPDFKSMHDPAPACDGRAPHLAAPHSPSALGVAGFAQ